MTYHVINNVTTDFLDELIRLDHEWKQSGQRRKEERCEENRQFTGAFGKIQREAAREPLKKSAEQIMKACISDENNGLIFYS